jgi:hypothetical protein
MTSKELSSQSETMSSLREITLDFIKKSYEIAKSRRMVNNRLGENQWVNFATGMEKLAVEQKLITPSEAKKIHESYPKS